MTPEAFIAKWQDNPLSEQSGAQTYFIDLCEMLGVDKPGDPENYCFERGATRTGAGRGWADVWKRNCFAWENKGPEGNLSLALKQLMTYALNLDNPPLLVVCNRALIEIHTHFTGTASEVHLIPLNEIGRQENLQKLRWVFNSPDKFKPSRTVFDVTNEAAGRFADIAQSMQARGHAPEKIAHFLIQCLFSMFAEDAGLLPAKLFQRIVDRSTGNQEKLTQRLSDLFTSMQEGGDFLLEEIAWFNGGLFRVIDPIPLEANEVKALLAASNMDWSHIEPAIFGTLFERGLDPAMRSQLGANYTDPGTIGKLIEPVIVHPLAAEWESAKAIITKAMLTYHGRGKGSKTAFRTAQQTFLGFIGRLKNFRVLDPACGSGNFLYLGLRALKDLEHRANLDAEALGLHRQITIETSPANMLGIEINAYAAELARVTVWIGEIQWMLMNGYEIQRRPILAPLDHIQCRDALLNPDGSESAWPAADAIVGNPPFLGDRKMRGSLGDDYVDRLRSRYLGRIPPGADLVCYWFEKARAAVQSNHTVRVGLVATNSIRGGKNRVVLDKIVNESVITDAWPDQPWVLDGAAVRVSIVAFAANVTHELARQDGVVVARINSDLTASASDLTRAVKLRENADKMVHGSKKIGSFEITGDEARELIKAGGNPNGRSNADVVTRSWNGLDVTGRDRDCWIVDFGMTMTVDEAALYERPFSLVVNRVKPERMTNRNPNLVKFWWRHGGPRPALRNALPNLSRVVATSAISKHRIWVWIPKGVLPDAALMVALRDDDVTFGVLHSRFHELWSLRLGTSLEDRPRYTPTSTFETYPFPDGLTPNLKPASYHNPNAGAVASAAQALNCLREAWLNPPDWVDRIPEVVPGYTHRIIAKPGHAAELRERTLTKLYNAMPPWLASAHGNLDEAVAKAYGWLDYTCDMPDEVILQRLLALNLARAS